MRKTFLEKCINLRLCRVALVLLFLVPAISSLQANPSQNKTISGVVTSATDSEPLIGVSVQVRETATGGITDIDGRYSVSAQQGQTLVFSYIGYQSQEIKVGTSSVINVVLKEDTEMLDEVVVVGYGVQKKKLVTGATVQVKGDEIAKMNTTNPLQAMQGQTPGVSIASTSGQPGADMKVSIRGLGTVGNSAPLYLIDGVGGDISTLNPADIESIDVLKDAASAAIYGSAGANGVVLITTKQGREGKAQISFDAYYGIQNVARKANMLNAKEYMAIMDEQALNSGLSAYDWSQYQSIYDANGNVYDTDWVDTMFKDNATTESYTLGVTGGSATSTYALSLGYMSQEGIVGGSDVSNYSRYNFRVNSEHKLFKDILKVGEQVSFVYKMNNGISVGNQYNNTLRGAFGTSPIAPVYSDNNLYDSPYNDTSTSDWNKGDGNPYGLMMTDSNNENKTATFSGNVYAELQPVKNLKIKSVFGVVYGSSEYRSFKPLYKFSQYIYNEDAIYKFLSITKIHDYDDLNTLFFQVLARDMGSRTHSIMRDFAYVPYLNSSLFEVTDLESKTIKINSLSQRTVLPVLASSVLRNKKRNLQVNALPTLQYLFAFLDAYNFASEGSEEVQEEAKTLINASVLGLIFEKINGHKDGSVFTPGFITMFMCREAITKTVLQKFNGYYGWNCTTRIELYNHIDNIVEANELIKVGSINSIFYFLHKAAEPFNCLEQ
ncbi:SusC/RagA family TonB-linked outer membrane protein, partial [Bacteroides uniformis]|uniref:SusC/RagA family TonB-linked outer membrane protein n=1 Tax=Bacteroides uniformis TaxID=820 RepID=UPI0039B6E8CF